MPIIQFQLENGIPVLFERLDHLHSATIGVWVLVGSRHESTPQHGISHLVEHMLFKGTKTRNALDIAESLEIVGGEINAFTSREYSCYWAKASTEHFSKACDVLSDLLVNSRFDEQEFVKERKVILEEIKMYEDSPEELCMDMLAQNVFDEGLGHPIVGTSKLIRDVQRDTVFGYYRKMYGPQDMFITIVGNVPEDQVHREIAKFHWQRRMDKSRVKPFAQARLTRGVSYRKKEIEQAHLTVAYGGLPVAAPNRYVLHTINAHLGSGMSSALFQEVREKRGLAYNIYTFVQSYRDIGILGIYCATSSSKVKDVLTIVRQEIERVKNEGVPPKRLTQMKEQLKGNLLLSLEKPSFRMTRMGVSHHYFGRIMPVEEIVATIESITQEDVAEMAKEILSRGYYAVSGVGNFPRKELTAGLGRPGKD